MKTQSQTKVLRISVFLEMLAISNSFLVKLEVGTDSSQLRVWDVAKGVEENILETTPEKVEKSSNRCADDGCGRCLFQ